MSSKVWTGCCTLICSSFDVRKVLRLWFIWMLNRRPVRAYKPRSQLVLPGKALLYIYLLFAWMLNCRPVSQYLEHLQVHITASASRQGTTVYIYLTVCLSICCNSGPTCEATSDWLRNTLLLLRCTSQDPVLTANPSTQVTYPDCDSVTLTRCLITTTGSSAL